jgi:hypothetical protein
MAQWPLATADARYRAAFWKPRFNSHVSKAMFQKPWFLCRNRRFEGQTLSTLSARAADRSGTSIGVPVAPPRDRWRNQPAKPSRRPRRSTLHDENFMPLHAVSRINPVAVNDIRAVYPHASAPLGGSKFTQNRNDAF